MYLDGLITMGGDRSVATSSAIRNAREQTQPWNIKSNDHGDKSFFSA